LEFLVVGLSHRTAPLEVREKLAVSKDQLPQAHKVAERYMSQGVILSTCNRSEFYTLGEGPNLEKSLHDFISDYFDIPLADISPYLYSYGHEECIRHLFRVASSLDSMILGEGEILRQVREAFQAAVEADAAKGPLSRLFNQALRVGKKVRRDTNISRNASSVSRACVELAKNLLGDLHQLTVMVIGTGDAGTLAARALKGSGASGIIVTNRTFERAVELSGELGGKAVPFDEMSEELREVDIVIGSTGSPGYVLEAAAVKEIMAARSERPLFLIDIAVPRDFDPAAAQVGNVFLYDVDDLQTISESKLLEREREARWAAEIVTQEVGCFLEWYRTLEVIPTVTDLRKMAEEVREREMARLLKRLDHKITHQETAQIEAMTRALVNKLLHSPTTRLKEKWSAHKLQVVKELFNLNGKTPSASEKHTRDKV